MIHFFITIYLAGEDGQIKIWSKSGMLRSTLVSQGKASENLFIYKQITITSGLSKMLNLISHNYQSHTSLAICHTNWRLNRLEEESVNKMLCYWKKKRFIFNMPL